MDPTPRVSAEDTQAQNLPSPNTSLSNLGSKCKQKGEDGSNSNLHNSDNKEDVEYNPPKKKTIRSITSPPPEATNASRLLGSVTTESEFNPCNLPILSNLPNDSASSESEDESKPKTNFNHKSYWIIVKASSQVSKSNDLQERKPILPSYGIEVGYDPSKRKRVRPRKRESEDDEVENNELLPQAQPDPPVKRKCGRPRRVEIEIAKRRNLALQQKARELCDNDLQKAKTFRKLQNTFSGENAASNAICRENYSKEFDDVVEIAQSSSNQQPESSLNQQPETSRAEQSHERIAQHVREENLTPGENNVHDSQSSSCDGISSLPLLNTFQFKVQTRSKEQVMDTSTKQNVEGQIFNESQLAHVPNDEMSSSQVDVSTKRSKQSNKRKDGNEDELDKVHVSDTERKATHVPGGQEQIKVKNGIKLKSVELQKYKNIEEYVDIEEACNSADDADSSTEQVKIIICEDFKLKSTTESQLSYNEDDQPAKKTTVKMVTNHPKPNTQCKVVCCDSDLSVVPSPTQNNQKLSMATEQHRDKRRKKPVKTIKTTASNSNGNMKSNKHAKHTTQPYRDLSSNCEQSDIQTDNSDITYDDFISHLYNDSATENGKCSGGRLDVSDQTSISDQQCGGVLGGTKRTACVMRNNNPKVDNATFLGDLKTKALSNAPISIEETIRDDSKKSDGANVGIGTTGVAASEAEIRSELDPGISLRKKQSVCVKKATEFLNRDLPRVGSKRQRMTIPRRPNNATSLQQPQVSEMMPSMMFPTVPIAVLGTDDITEGSCKAAPTTCRTAATNRVKTKRKRTGRPSNADLLDELRADMNTTLAHKLPAQTDNVLTDNSQMSDFWRPGINVSEEEMEELYKDFVESLQQPVSVDDEVYMERLRETRYSEKYTLRKVCPRNGALLRTAGLVKIDSKLEKASTVCSSVQTFRYNSEVIAPVPSITSSNGSMAEFGTSGGNAVAVCEGIVPNNPGQNIQVTSRILGFADTPQPKKKRGRPRKYKISRSSKVVKPATLPAQIQELSSNTAVLENDQQSVMIDFNGLPNSSLTALARMVTNLENAQPLTVVEETNQQPRHNGHPRPSFEPINGSAAIGDEATTSKESGDSPHFAKKKTGANVTPSEQKIEWIDPRPSFEPINGSAAIGDEATTSKESGDSPHFAKKKTGANVTPSEQKIERLRKVSSKKVSDNVDLPSVPPVLADFAATEGTPDQRSIIIGVHEKHMVAGTISGSPQKKNKVCRLRKSSVKNPGLQTAANAAIPFGFEPTSRVSERSPMKKKRGRPFKNPPVDNNTGLQTATVITTSSGLEPTPSVSEQSPTKKKRGRPSKNPPVYNSHRLQTAVAVAIPSDFEPSSSAFEKLAMKKRRGRPPKNPIDSNQSTINVPCLELKIAVDAGLNNVTQSELLMSNEQQVVRSSDTTCLSSNITCDGKNSANNIDSKAPTDIEPTSSVSERLPTKKTRGGRIKNSPVDNILGLQTAAIIATPPGLEPTSSASGRLSMKKKRGRPSKNPPVDNNPGLQTGAVIATPPGLEPTPSASGGLSMKKKRGRPSKNPTVDNNPGLQTGVVIATPPGLEPTSSAQPPVKKKRGRPSKNRVDNNQSTINVPAIELSVEVDAGLNNVTQSEILTNNEQQVVGSSENTGFQSVGKIVTLPGLEPTSSAFEQLPMKKKRGRPSKKLDGTTSSGIKKGRNRKAVHSNQTGNNQRLGRSPNKNEATATTKNKRKKRIPTQVFVDEQKTYLGGSKWLAPNSPTNSGERSLVEEGTAAKIDEAEHTTTDYSTRPSAIPVQIPTGEGFETRAVRNTDVETTPPSHDVLFNVYYYAVIAKAWNAHLAHLHGTDVCTYLQYTPLKNLVGCGKREDEKKDLGITQDDTS